MRIIVWRSDVCSSDLIGVAQLQRHRAAARALIGGAVPYDGADMRQRLADFGVGDQVVEEGPLAAQGLQRPVRLDAAMVDAARQIEKTFGAVAEMRREPDRVLRGGHGARKATEPPLSGERRVGERCVRWCTSEGGRDT